MSEIDWNQFYADHLAEQDDLQEYLAKTKRELDAKIESEPGINMSDYKWPDEVVIPRPRKIVGKIFGRFVSINNLEKAEEDKQKNR